jgi:hypothetical protein
LPWWEEWLEEAPAWLVSLLIHMGLVIVLGLCALGVQQHFSEPMEVQIGSAESMPSGSLDESLGSGLDEGAPGLLADEFDATLPPTPILADLPTDSHEAVAGLGGEWHEMALSADGNGTLLPGLGDSLGSSLLGNLAGGGNGGDGNGEFDGGLGIPRDKTSFFGLAGEGGKFVYVLDRSDSMNMILSRFSEGTLVGNVIPLQVAKTELKRSLAALSSTSKFQIVFYNDRIEVFRTGRTYHKLYSATKANKVAAYNYIDNTPGQGGTYHKIALEAAVDFEPDVIFLLTDARVENDLPYDVVDRVVAYCKRHHIVLNVVHFANMPRPDCTLIEMAERTGGKHIFINLTTFMPFGDPDEADGF